jgi:Cu-Zn family superoxide dismutase
MTSIKECLKAKADMHGNLFAPYLSGTVQFYETPVGVKVSAVICNLPPNDTGFYGFHLHQRGNCMGIDFKRAGEHYNPKDLKHPLHAGDFPMLLVTDKSDAYLSFVTTRFTINEIIGRSVIIHYDVDDYTSQPSGNAGIRIGCGIICKVYSCH